MLNVDSSARAKKEKSAGPAERSAAVVSEEEDASEDGDEKIHRRCHHALGPRRRDGCLWRVAAAVG